MRILHFYNQPQNTRGVAVFKNNLEALNDLGLDVTVHTIQYASANSDAHPGTYNFDGLSPEEIVEIANTYDYVIQSSFHSDIETISNYWHKITKPIKVYFEHGDIFKRGSFEKCTVPLLESTDGLMTYSTSNLLSSYVQKTYPHLYNRLYKFRTRLAFHLYQNDIDLSFQTTRDLPYIIESGVWEGQGSKNSGEMSRLLKYANELGISFDPYIFLHIGISFNPGVYFNHIKRYPDTSVKCGKKIDRYMDSEFSLNVPGPKTNRVFLMRDYECAWMVELMMRSPFSYSLMTTQLESGKHNPNIAGRFEYSQLEKCIYSLPILDRNYLALFEDMDRVTRESFLSVDVLNEKEYKKSIGELRETMRYLHDNPEEYNTRRKRIVQYVKTAFSMEGVIEEITAIDKK